MDKTIRSEIYIGKNGIGKSKELEQIGKTHQEKSLHIKFSGKGNSADDGVVSPKNEMLDQFQKFLNTIFECQFTIDAKSLPEEEHKKFKEKFNQTREQSELDKIWEDLKKDNNVSFLEKWKTNVLTSEKGQKLEIKKNFYQLNLDTFKQTNTEANVKKQKENTIISHGSGKFAYFQIKFIYAFRELINENASDFYLIIDEPELFLHNTLKKQVAYMLKVINQKMNVIIATHSSTIANNFYRADQTKIFTKRNHQETKWSEITLYSPNIFPNRKVYFDSLLANKIIICEGSNDTKLLNYLILDDLEWECEKDVLVISSLELRGEGKSSIPQIFGVIKKTKFNGEDFISDENIFVIYDQDKINGVEKNEDHKKWNANIEKLKKDEKSKLLIYGFDENLEVYFDINNKNMSKNKSSREKEEWDESVFFSNEDNKEKLKEFLKESNLDDFLGLKLK